MDDANLDRHLSHRIADDAELARLLARLGPRESMESGREFGGEAHVAPLDVGLATAVRVFLRVEPTGAPGYVQGVRLVSLPPRGASPVGDPVCPLLAAAPEELGRWVALRRPPADAIGPGRVLGYQGWWRYGPAVHSDTSTRVVAHARHRRGDLLWITSRTNLLTPGDEHKQAFVVVVAPGR